MKKINKSSALLLFCFCLVVGIFTGFLFYDFGVLKRGEGDILFFIYTFAIILLVLLILFFNKSFIKIIIIGALVFLGGFVRFYLYLPQTLENQIDFYNGGMVEFSGQVVVEPDIRVDHTKLTVESVQIFEPNKKVSGKVLIKTALFPEYYYGDVLNIKCKLQKPEQIEDFAYDKYLARHDIYSVCYRPQISLVSRVQKGFYFSLYKAKNRLKNIIEKSLPEPHAGIVIAMTLGDKRKIPTPLLKKFSQTGISHIIAISGMHIIILTTILLNIFIFIGFTRYQSFYLVVASVFLYILLIGFPASALRAGVMVTVFLLARHLGRLGSSINALVFTATLMLVFNPFLLYDIGFQLSFLAVLGLIYLLPCLENIFKKVPEFWQIKQLVLVSVSAQIATLPIIIYNFGIFSLVAIFSNLLIMPIIPMIMILSIIMLFVGIFWSSLAVLVGYLLWVVVGYMLLVVDLLVFRGFGFFEMRMNFGFVIVFYLLLIIFLKRSFFEKK